jgi:hypothetical protein
MRFKPYTVPVLRKSQTQKFKLWCHSNNVTCKYKNKPASLEYIFNNFLIKSHDTKFYQKGYHIIYESLYTLFLKPDADIYYVDTCPPFNTDFVSEIQSIPFDYHQLKIALGKPIDNQWFLKINGKKIWISCQKETWWMSRSDKKTIEYLYDHIESESEDMNTLEKQMAQLPI